MELKEVIKNKFKNLSNKLLVERLNNKFKKGANDDDEVYELFDKNISYEIVNRNLKAYWGEDVIKNNQYIDLMDLDKKSVKITINKNGKFLYKTDDSRSFMSYEKVARIHELEKQIRLIENEDN